MKIRSRYGRLCGRVLLMTREITITYFLFGRQVQLRKGKRFARTIRFED